MMHTCMDSTGCRSQEPVAAPFGVGVDSARYKPQREWSVAQTFEFVN